MSTISIYIKNLNPVAKEFAKGLSDFEFIWLKVPPYSLLLYRDYKSILGEDTEDKMRELIKEKLKLADFDYYHDEEYIEEELNKHLISQGNIPIRIDEHVLLQKLDTTDKFILQMFER